MDVKRILKRPTALVAIIALLIAATNSFSSDSDVGLFLISAAYAKDGGDSDGGDNDGGDNSGSDNSGSDSDNSGSGSDSSGNGSDSSGNGSDSDSSGSDSNDSDSSGRSGKKGKGKKTRRSGAEVRYSNGWVEGIISGIYTVKDAKDRTVISRKATPDDVKRMDRQNDR